MIRYFWKGLKLSVRAQLNARGQDLDSWKETIEKAVNAKTKTLLQSSFNICKIDSSCPHGNKPIKKEEKDFRKTKSADSPFTDAPNRKFIYQSQTNKKNQNQNHQ